MQYSQVIKFLYSRAVMRKKWGLKNIKRLLNLLGNPHKKLKVVHVTGTNGKGSTTTMIASILEKAGYRTGRYISPHIDDFRERITVNGKKITEMEVVEIFKKMKKFISGFKKNELSFFEITTALAYVYFEREGVDFAVLETGLGGRLDATNVVDSIVSVITNVDVEHTDYLGNTVRQIAREKAGIIKRNSVLVTAESKNEVLRVFDNMCAKKNSRLVLVGRDLKYKKIVSDARENAFEIKSRKRYIAKLGMLGSYQGRNAAVAVAVAEALGIGKRAIEKGLRSAWLPARLEIIGKKPFVIMDSAHNPAAMKNLSSELKMFSYKRLILVIGLMKDKDIHGIVSIIARLANVVIINKPAVDRAAEPWTIVNCAGAFCKKIIIERNVRKSIKVAKAMAEKEDLILITGSMYMLSEAREANGLRVAQ